MQKTGTARVPIHQQPCKKYATLLHVTINNALVLVVGILNICKFKVFKVANETMG
jgi:hypothetical protein